MLLVGGMDSMIYGSSRDDANQGSADWYVPVRYTNLDVGSYDDPGFISDLYYADLYKEGGVFEDWDSNDNGIFSEWIGFRKDECDLSPDVFVGRLACRNTNEVRTMVEKIITYEAIEAIVASGSQYEAPKDVRIDRVDVRVYDELLSGKVVV